MQRIKLFLVCTTLVGGLALGLSPTAQAQDEERAPGLSATEPTGPFKVTFNENGTAHRTSCYPSKRSRFCPPLQSRNTFQL